VTNRKKNIFTNCKKCIFLHFSDVYFFKKRPEFRVLKPTEHFFGFFGKMRLLFSVTKKTRKKCLLMFTFSLLFGSKKVQYIKVTKIFFLKKCPDQNIFFKFMKKKSKIRRKMAFSEIFSFEQKNPIFYKNVILGDFMCFLGPFGSIF
jgi:hypothetical protein